MEHEDESFIKPSKPIEKMPMSGKLDADQTSKSFYYSEKIDTIDIPNPKGEDADDPDKRVEHQPILAML
jgi:hypothetical protein